MAIAMELSEKDVDQIQANPAYVAAINAKDSSRTGPGKTSGVDRRRKFKESQTCL